VTDSIVLIQLPPLFQICACTSAALQSFDKVGISMDQWISSFTSVRLDLKAARRSLWFVLQLDLYPLIRRISFCAHYSTFLDRLIVVIPQSKFGPIGTDLTAAAARNKENLNLPPWSKSLYVYHKSRAHEHCHRRDLALTIGLRCCHSRIISQTRLYCVTIGPAPISAIYAHEHLEC